MRRQRRILNAFCLLLNPSVVQHKPVADPERSDSYKSYLTFLGPPLVYAGQHLGNFARNAFNILRWRLHQDSGMKELIERFHASLPRDRPPPISYREILLTARIMDMLFEQFSEQRNGSRSNSPTPD